MLYKLQWRSLTTFKLSFDEFLELYEGRLPSFSFAELCAVGIISLIAAAFCILLLYSATEIRLDDASIYVLLLSAFSLVPFLIQWLTNHDRKKTLESFREIYQQAYSGERAFSFDDRGWTLRTESGKQEASWSSTRAATDSTKTFSVFCPDQLTIIIPKRVLPPEELDSLKQRAIGQNDGFTSSIGILDYVVSGVPILWRRRPLVMGGAHFLGIASVLYLLSHVRTDSQIAASVGWAVCGALLLWVATAQVCYLVLKYEQTGRYFFHGWQVQFSDDGVRARSKYWESFNAWCLFPKVTEGLHCFVLDVSASDAWLVSKKSVPPEQRSEFRRHITSRRSAGEAPQKA